MFAKTIKKLNNSIILQMIEMFIEVFKAIFWWNPFAYLLRYNLNTKSLKKLSNGFADGTYSLVVK